MHYQVVVQQEAEGFTVSVPALPGCISEGDTEAEALESLKSAIKEWRAAGGTPIDAQIVWIEVDSKAS